MQYRSKPHTIEGFKVEHNCVAPDWFNKAIVIGRVIVVNNDKNLHVLITDIKGGVRRAYEGDYVCINNLDTIFPLSQEEMKKDFEEIL